MSMVFHHIVCEDYANIGLMITKTAWIVVLDRPTLNC